MIYETTMRYSSTRLGIRQLAEWEFSRTCGSK